MVKVTPARTHRIVPPSTPWRERRRLVSRQIEASVRWVEEHGLSTVVRWGAVILVSAIPTLQNFGIVTNRWWLLPWVAALVTVLVFDHHRHGASLIRLIRGIGYINSSFGGSFDTISNKIPSDGGCLTEEGSQSACIGFLHRIRDYTAFALRAEKSPRLRATLAVPIVTDGSVKALRIWAYDEPHSDRGFTTIPLYDDKGQVLGGAPAAYLTQDIHIVEDVHRMRGGHLVGASQRPYRSILSIPLSARDTDGKPLAVINVDADEPNFFEPETVLDRVMPLLAPVVNAMGLVLRMRTPGATYDFPR
jgi:hypothetical protein